MRVVRRMAGALLLGVLVLVSVPGAALAVPGAPAVHGGPAPAGYVAQGYVAQGYVAQQNDPQPPDGEPTREGPRLDPSTEADSNLAQSKAIVGGMAAALLAIVLYGRHVRKKRRKAAGG